MATAKRADVLDRFSPATAAWFRGSFTAPTSAQAGAWDAISSGHHCVVVAPTGSGKTLSAFLWAIDRMASEPVPEDKLDRERVIQAMIESFAGSEAPLISLIQDIVA